MIEAITALLFVMPGALILFHKNFFPRFTSIEKLPFVISLSVSYWIISFWWLRFFAIPRTMFLLVSLGIALLFFLGLLWARRKKIRITTAKVGREFGMVLWFIIMAIPPLIVTHNQLAPSGPDMSMHAYLAKNIVLHNGFPNSLEPIAPVTSFGTYPVGFSIIIADMTLANGLPVYTNALWLTAFTYWFFGVSMFILLRCRFSFIASALATLLVAWVSYTPRDVIEWGANPTILSLDFLIVAGAYLITTSKKQFPLLLCLTFVTAILVHYMLPIAVSYLGLFLLPFLWQKARRLHPRPWILIIVVLVIVLPFLSHINVSSLRISDSVAAYTSKLQQQEFSEWTGTIHPSILGGTTRFLINTVGSPVLLLYLISLLIVALTKKRTFLFAFLYSLGIYVLLINAQHWWLPFSAALYPKRIVLLLLIPIAIMVAEAWEMSVRLIYTHGIIKNRTNYTVLVSLLLAVVGYMYYPYLSMGIRGFIASKHLSVVTKEDLIAMAWLSAHTTNSDVIMNNYYDAGLWIPAIADRHITTYHTNPFDMEHFTNDAPPTYAYQGSKTLTQSPGIDPVQQAITTNRDRYTEVFSQGNVRIYKIQTPK